MNGCKKEKVIKNLGCTTLHIQLTFFFGQLTFKSTSERQKQKKRQKEREKKKETKTSLCLYFLRIECLITFFTSSSVLCTK